MKADETQASAGETIMPETEENKKHKRLKAKEDAPKASRYLKPTTVKASFQ
jgi:hypothetical protein